MRYYEIGCEKSAQTTTHCTLKCYATLRASVLLLNIYCGAYLYILLARVNDGMSG